MKTMKVLFIQGGTRLKEDDKGNWYTDGNFNDGVWKRYTSICDELTVLLRREEKIYKNDYAVKKFNKFDTNIIRLVPLMDMYTPIYRMFNPFLKCSLYKTIENEVKKVDKVIIRSVVNIYTVSALKACKKLNKPYALEVTGVGWDGTWYHGLTGKPLAWYIEKRLKASVADAPYVLYVTQTELQERYPCRGKTVGCSNVELEAIDQNALIRREKKINEDSNRVVLGTIGNYNLKTKGQDLVIRAIAQLRKQGFTNIEYQLIGSGSEKKLQALAEKQGVSGQVKFIGTMPHEDIFNWLDSIDIYIQPSYQEGLCRSVVEAMSRACPVICSDACGERELAGEDNIFKRGDWKSLSKKIQGLAFSTELMLADAVRGYAKSKEYKKEVLDKRRRDYYFDFIES